MSRSLGSTSLTTRSPMRSSPVEIDSRPATRRNAVDLPQPDEPTNTRNSPSAMSRLRSWIAWKPFSYVLLTESRVTVAMSRTLVLPACATEQPVAVPVEWSDLSVAEIEALLAEHGCFDFP